MENNKAKLAIIERAFNRSIDDISKKAVKELESFRHKAKNSPNCEYTVDSYIAVRGNLVSFTCSQILDDVQGDVLRQFTDGNIEDLDIYEDSCALRADYQVKLENQIDRHIDDLSLYSPKYAVLDVKSTDNEADIFDELELAEKKLEALKATDKYEESDYKLQRLQLISVDFETADDGDTDSDPNYHTTIKAFIGDNVEESKFYVQLCNGYHLSQMGCEVSGESNSDFTELERVMFDAYDVINLTENYALAEINEKYVYHDIGFNVSIGSQSLYVRENTENSQFELVVVNDDFNVNNYNTKENPYMSFDTLNKAQEFVNDFKTDEYYDFSGLSKLFDEIKGASN